jgi:hypothetical protein
MGAGVRACFTWNKTSLWCESDNWPPARDGWHMVSGPSRVATRCTPEGVDVWGPERVVRLSQRFWVGHGRCLPAAGRTAPRLDGRGATRSRVTARPDRPVRAVDAPGTQWRVQAHGQALPREVDRSAMGTTSSPHGWIGTADFTGCGVWPRGTDAYVDAIDVRSGTGRRLAVLAADRPGSLVHLGV